MLGVTFTMMRPNVSDVEGDGGNDEIDSRGDKGDDDETLMSQMVVVGVMMRPKCFR